MQEEWELSQSLESLDGQGVRAACVLQQSSSNAAGVEGGNMIAADEYRLVTGNQAGGLMEFGVPSGAVRPIAFQHDHAVTQLLSANDHSFYMSACKDGIIRQFSASDHSLQATLKGHQKPVTSLAWCQAGTSEDTFYLLSGSWDGTAKVWDIERKVVVATMEGHENSVCVAGLPPLSSAASGTGSVLYVATGSAGQAAGNVITGHSTRIWSVNVATGDVSLLSTLSNDHEGPIREICLVPNSPYFATCSNDGSVKLRALRTGQPTTTLTFVQQNTQHPPMLLSVAADAAGTYIAASAEDGHVVVWQTNGEDGPQQLNHAVCVWRVVAIPNGDLATCSQDGVVRIFTRSTERMATVAERQAFAENVQQQKQQQQKGPTPEEIAKLPVWGIDSAHKKGTSEGQVQIFQKDGMAIAAQWSMASQTWIEVGQVMGGMNNNNDGGDGGGNVIDGVRYDLVLPIEVDQTGGGVAKLRLGYNNGENPFVAAQRFIDQYQLPQYHLSQIADYIQQRMGGASAPTLGSAGPPPSATTGIPIASYQYLPVPHYMSFELSSKSAAATFEKMRKKIEEYDLITADDAELLSQLMETLATGNRYHASQISDQELNFLQQMWTKSMEATSNAPDRPFPVLDLWRMTVLHPHAASREPARQSYWIDVLTQVMKYLEQKNPDNASSTAKPMAIVMLSLRLFCNAFKGGTGSLHAVSSLLEQVLRSARQAINGQNHKNVRLSVATLLHNACYYVSTQESASDTVYSTLVGMINDVLMDTRYERDAVHRTLLGLGTLALRHAPFKAKATSEPYFLLSKVEPAAVQCAADGSTEIKALGKEVYAVLAS